VNLATLSLILYLSDELFICILYKCIFLAFHAESSTPAKLYRVGNHTSIMPHVGGCMLQLAQRCPNMQKTLISRLTHFGESGKGIVFFFFPFQGQLPTISEILVLMSD
jgi:hypothetical protein